MNNVSRIAALLKEEGADWAILTGADSVCFATGHVVPIEIGQSPFSGGPTVALVGSDGSVGLVCPNTDGAQGGSHEEITYTGFANAVTDQVLNYRLAVSDMVNRLGVSGTLACEPDSFTQVLAEVLPERRVSFQIPLARLRAVKNDDEIARMTVAAQVAAEGQQTARLLSVAGADELAVFGAVRSKMEQCAGMRIAFAGELLTGVERSSRLGTSIATREIHDGDPVICDLAPRVNGYWGDSCSAFVVGGAPEKDYERMYNAARETLRLAVAELRPGLRVCDFDASLRGFMKGQGYAYPHHSGHGIGTSVHEYPRLVPDETCVFEENMFIMVEPGSYEPGIGGLRCEYMLRVSATGCEVVAPFDMSCRSTLVDGNTGKRQE